MANLFTKDEDLMKSAPYIGSEILKQLQSSDDGRISIYDLAKSLRKSNKITARSIYYGMIFLYSLDIVEFDEPYLIKNVAN
ncbi:hypothetical protein [Kangiella koreensis]|uniref:Uncharacterized protein n=1 Tax=Kangiella koreensis (strain DSM 16069 / JCM 12317 / KCTC 12182 / SW-125) TaxID=523791 RepID=C7R6V4_KANKD|nr:hypothetical protein [Kangiella koreensis]ACV25620.1 conserved hypothetical protein [Kangiella koreensis DSM 16069]